MNTSESAVLEEKSSLGEGLFESGEYKQALSVFEECLLIAPKELNLWINKAICLDKLGNTEESISACDEGLKIDSKYDFLLELKAYNLASLGEYEDAHAAFEEYLSINPNKSAWLAKATCLEKMGKFEQGLSAYEEASKIDPLDSKILCSKALVLHKLGKHKEAEAACDEALVINPSFEAWETKGVVLLFLKNESALENLCKALEINPNEKMTWHHKACCLMAMGNYEGAIESLDEVLKLDPQNKEALSDKKVCQNKVATAKMFRETDYMKLPAWRKEDLSQDCFLKDKYEESELRMIGAGTIGKVFFAKRKTGGNIAVKVIEIDSEQKLKASINELINMAVVRDHPNIITYQSFDVKQVPFWPDKNVTHQIFVEMPLASTNLKFLLDQQPRFTEAQVLFIFKQLVTGLHFAHSRKLAHLNLKPENVLFFGETCMIADWLGSRELSASSDSKGYEAPELEPAHTPDNVRGRGHGCSNLFLCDIYSVALVLIRLCGTPYGTLLNIPKTVKKEHDLYLRDSVFQIGFQKFYSKELLDLLKGMAAFEPKERISLEKAIVFADSKI